MFVRIHTRKHHTDIKQLKEPKSCRRLNKMMISEEQIQRKALQLRKMQTNIEKAKELNSECDTKRNSECDSRATQWMINDEINK